MRLQLLGITCLLTLLGVIIFGCAPQSMSETADIDRLFRDYELQPTDDKAEIYLDSLDSFVRSNIEDTQKIKASLDNGINVSMAQGILSRAPGYLLPMLRLYPNLENRKSYLLKLGDVMYALRKRHASSIIYKELVISHKGDQEVEQKGELIDSLAALTPDYLGYLFDQILINPGEMGVNREASLKYVDGVEAMALVAPDKESVPGHLYKAAEVARSMRTFPKALSLYDWLIDTYPSHDKAPTALFIKGFILEQDYDRLEEAEEIYTRFLSEYPNHEMAGSAKFLLENIGKSDEEILQEIEQKKNDN